jgi:putative effector of murein hydrolase
LIAIFKASGDVISRAGAVLASLTLGVVHSMYIEKDFYHFYINERTLTQTQYVPVSVTAPVNIAVSKYLSLPLSS